jgi:hypothetical protein
VLFVTTYPFESRFDSRFVKVLDRLVDTQAAIFHSAARILSPHARNSRQRKEHCIDYAFAASARSAPSTLVSGGHNRLSFSGSELSFGLCGCRCCRFREKRFWITRLDEATLHGVHYSFQAVVSTKLLVDAV